MMRHDRHGPHDVRHPAWTGLPAMACAAVLMGLSPAIQRLHNSDSVLFSLMSTQKWTPMYWEQNRLGALLPLLAVPIRDPLGNLLFQNVLGIHCCFLGLWLIGWFVSERQSGMIASLAGGMILGLLAPEDTVFGIFVWHNFHLVSFVFGLSGLMMLGLRADQPWRRPGPARAALACMLLVIAFWVNIAILFVLIPMIVFQQVFCRRWKHEETGSVRGGSGGSPLRRPSIRAPVAWGVLSSGCIAVAVQLIINACLPENMWTDTALAPVTLWGYGWRRTLMNLLREFRNGATMTCLVIFCLAGARSLARHGRRSVLLTNFHAPLALVVPAGVFFFIPGVLRHVMNNLYAPRYVYPTALLMLIACVLATQDMIGEIRCLNPRWMGLALSMLLPASMFMKYGAPDIHGIYREFDRDWGDRAREAMEKDCTHVVGSYWDTWTTVFWGNKLYFDLGRRRQMFGVAHRASATRELWKDMRKDRFRFALVTPNYRRREEAMIFRLYDVPRMDHQVMEKGNFIRVHPAL